MDFDSLISDETASTEQIIAVFEGAVFDKVNKIAKAVPLISRLAEHHEIERRKAGCKCIQLVLEKTNPSSLLWQMGLPDYFFKILTASMTWNDEELLAAAFEAFKAIPVSDLDKKLSYCDEVLFLLLAELETNSAMRPSYLKLLAKVIEMEGLAASRFLSRILLALDRCNETTEVVREQLRLHCWPLIEHRGIKL